MLSVQHAAWRQGYYIETCVRMRYKAEYAPSDLLCSRAGVWVPYERVAGALRADPSCILSQVLPHTRSGLGLSLNGVCPTSGWPGAARRHPLHPGPGYSPV